MEKWEIETDLKNYPQIIWLKEFLIGHPGIIAGGCFKSIFTGQKPHDIDMFFRSGEDFTKAIMYFKEHKEEYTPGYENRNVESFIHTRTGTRIECVRKIYGSPIDIISQFDFTIAKFAYEIESEPPEDEDGDWEYTDKIIYHHKFFEHLVMKRLVVDDVMPYPISTYNRTYKYSQSGFLPCRETKLKIIEAIRDLEDNPGETDLAESMYEGHD